EPFVMSPSATARSAVGPLAAIRAVLAASLALASSLAHHALLPSPGMNPSIMPYRRLRAEPHPSPSQHLSRTSPVRGPAARCSARVLAQKDRVAGSDRYLCGRFSR